MKIFTRTQLTETDDELQAHIERHVRFALNRFSDRVWRVHVQIRDLNGPRGGLDTECKIRVELDTRASLLVKELDSCPFAAVANATSRLGRVVSKHVDRVQRTRRARARAFQNAS